MTLRAMRIHRQAEPCHLESKFHVHQVLKISRLEHQDPHFIDLTCVLSDLLLVYWSAAYPEIT